MPNLCLPWREWNWPGSPASLSTDRPARVRTMLVRRVDGTNWERPARGTVLDGSHRRSWTKYRMGATRIVSRDGCIRPRFCCRRMRAGPSSRRSSLRMKRSSPAANRFLRLAQPGGDAPCARLVRVRTVRRWRPPGRRRLRPSRHRQEERRRKAGDQGEEQEPESGHRREPALALLQGGWIGLPRSAGAVSDTATCVLGAEAKTAVAAIHIRWPDRCPC